MATRTPIRLSDIAEKARTSVSTVSLALAGDPRIGDDTKRRIRELSKQLGYQPRRSFRSDVARRTAKNQERLRFGFLAVDRLDVPAHAALLQALSHVAQESNIRLEILSIPVERADETLVDRACEFGRTLDGLIVMGSILMDHLRQITQAGIPVVMYGYPLGHVDQHDIPITIVTSDWQGMGHQATQAMIERGHRRIGFISGEIVPGMWHSRCLDGYATAHLHAGLDLDRNYILTAKHNQDAGTAAARAVLAMKGRPSAYVAINAGTAGRFLSVMNEANVPVKREELVICGYAHLMAESGVADFPLVSMDPTKIVEVALAQLRTRCTQPGSVSATIFAPFDCSNLPPRQA